jgi:hypothetical protein
MLEHRSLARIGVLTITSSIVPKASFAQVPGNLAPRFRANAESLHFLVDTAWLLDVAISVHWKIGRFPKGSAHVFPQGMLTIK